VLPRTRSGKYAVLAALAIGGSVAVAMVVLFTAYLVETVRNIQ